MSSGKHSPLGNVLGFIGFFAGFYLGYKNSGESILVGFIVGIVIAALGAALGNLLWQILLVALSVLVIFVQRQIAREVVVKPIVNSFNTDEKNKPAAYTPPPSPDYREAVIAGKKIYINNTCRYPIELAIRYQDANGEWYTLGWYTIGANLNTFLNSNAQALLTTNTTFYYFAKVPGHKYAWFGDESQYFDGQTLQMKKAEFQANEYGEYEYSINCNNFDEVVNSESNGRSVMLKNNCKKMVSLALAYQDMNGNWTTKGWYKVDANQHRFLLDGSAYIKTTHSTIYFFANVDGENIEWAGDELLSLNGTKLPMRKAIMEMDEKGAYYFSLNCDNILNN